MWWVTRMATLPTTDDSLLVRTTFGDDAGWAALRDAVGEENADGFRAHVTVVDDLDQADASWQDLREAVRDGGSDAAVLFVADEHALGPDHPVLVVDLGDEARPAFRCAAAELGSVDNNLNLANMGWEEFADATGDDGVFRGISTA